MKIGAINWIWIFTIVTLVVHGLRGRREGFIRAVFGMFSFVLALAAASMAGPEVSKAIKMNEKVVPYVSQKVNTKELTFPEIVKRAVLNEKSAEEYRSLATQKAEEVLQIQIANWIINAVSFVLVFLLVYILLGYVSATLNIISKQPILNGLNKTAGILVGVLQGFISIWFWCIVLTIFSTTMLGQIIFAYVNQSEFLGLLYNNNLLFEFGKIFL